jgi:hypothetical protein
MQSKDDLNNKIVILIPYLGWDGMVIKCISHYCPFKSVMMKGEGGSGNGGTSRRSGGGGGEGGITRGSIVCTI